MTARFQACSSVASAAVIGSLAWQGPLWLLSTAIVVPALAYLQLSRGACFAVVAAYYAAASWEMVPVLQAGPWLGGRYSLSVIICALAVLVLSSPWTTLWTADVKDKPIHLAAAFVISVVPPVGLIGWASPVIAAGILFPGMKWIGLGIIVLIPSLLVTQMKTVTLAVIFASSVAANVLYEPAKPIPGWIAVDVAHRVPKNKTVGVFEAVIAIERSARVSTGDVLIFPESTLPRWNEATRHFSDSLNRSLVHKRRFVVVGTTFPISSSSEQQNGAILLGTGGEEVRYIQRVPVPLAMWNPFAEAGFRPCLHCPGTIRIGQRRAAVLICYEQLLPWTLVHSTLESPTVLVGISSSVWTQRTTIPAAQALCLRAWARLFRLPVVIATKS